MSFSSDTESLSALDSNDVVSEFSSEEFRPSDDESQEEPEEGPSDDETDEVPENDDSGDEPAGEPSGANPSVEITEQVAGPSEETPVPAKPAEDKGKSPAVPTQRQASEPAEETAPVATATVLKPTGDPKESKKSKRSKEKQKERVTKLPPPAAPPAPGPSEKPDEKAKRKVAKQAKAVPTDTVVKADTVTITKPSFVSSEIYAKGTKLRGEIQPEQTNVITAHIKEEILEIYTEVMGKPPLNNDPRNMLFRKEKKFGTLLQAVFKAMHSMNSSVNIKEPQWRSWISDKFSDIHRARKTVLRMFIEPVTGKKGFVDLRAQMRKSFEGVRIGIAGKDYGENHCYESFKRCLDEVTQTFPILAAMEKYDAPADAKFDKVMKYFGPTTLPGLTRAKFWDNFNNINELIEYIEQDPFDIARHDDDVTEVMKTSNIKNDLFVCLMKAQTPELIEHFGYSKHHKDMSCPQHFWIGTYLRELRALSDTEADISAVRRVVTLNRVAYSPEYGSDNSRFFHWLEDLNDIQADGSLNLEDQEYFQKAHDNCLRNVREIYTLEQLLLTKPIVNANAMRYFIRKAMSWKRSTRKPEEPQPTQQEVVAKPKRKALHHVSAPESPINKLRRNYVEALLQEEPNTCVLCAMHGDSDGSKDYVHSWQDCHIIWRIGLRKLDPRKDWGKAVVNALKSGTLKELIDEADEKLKTERDNHRKKAKKSHQSTAKATKPASK